MTYEDKKMVQEWIELAKLVGSRKITVERVRVEESGIVLEGEFQLPPLAKLGAEDQVFVAAFVRCHGSIKQMENFLGVSYPTVKSRLNRISKRLDFVEIVVEEKPVEALDQLERGEISVEEAIEKLKEARDS